MPAQSRAQSSLDKTLDQIVAHIMQFSAWYIQYNNMLSLSSFRKFLAGHINRLEDEQKAFDLLITRFFDKWGLSMQDQTVRHLMLNRYVMGKNELKGYLSRIHNKNLSELEDLRRQIQQAMYEIAKYHTFDRPDCDLLQTYRKEAEMLRNTIHNKTSRHINPNRYRPAVVMSKLDTANQNNETSKPAKQDKECYPSATIIETADPDRPYPPSELLSPHNPRRHKASSRWKYSAQTFFSSCRTLFGSCLGRQNDHHNYNQLN